MSDKKISELTALTAPDGAEELVVNDSGTSKKITQTNLLSTALPLAGGTMTGTIAGFTSTGIDDNATSTKITVADTGIDVTGSVTADGLTVNDTGGASISHGYSLINSSARNGSGSIQLSSIPSIAMLLDYHDANQTVATVRNTYGATSALAELALDSGFITFNTGTSFTERMRIDSAGNVNVNTGNLVIGTSGKGIDFSADGNAAGMTSEVLDDYETGTWTPAISDGTNSPTMAAQVGKYTKIGNLVTAEGYINVSAVGSATGVIRIAGLPFTNDGAANSFGVCSFGYMNNSSLTSGTTPSGYIAGSSAYAALYVWDSTYTTQLTMAEWGTADAIFEITYRV